MKSNWFLNLWWPPRPDSLSKDDRLVFLAADKMHYEKSLQIEQRLSELLELIQSGRYSTPELAERVGVSVPTVSRSIQALRERGHEIVAEKAEGSWHYELATRKRTVAK